MINIDEVIKGIIHHKLRQKNIQKLNHDECFDCPYRPDGMDMCESIDALLDDVLALLKEQEIKTPIRIHEEYPEHDWETDKDGKIDEWFMNYEFHNGPACQRCGYSFCIHCKPNGWNEKPCIVDYYQCPKCKERIFKHGKNIEYCIKCGQAVKWE